MKSIDLHSLSDGQTERNSRLLNQIPSSVLMCAEQEWRLVHGFYIYILYDYWTQAGSEIYGVVGDILKFSAKIVFLVNSKA